MRVTRCQRRQQEMNTNKQTKAPQMWKDCFFGIVDGGSLFPHSRFSKQLSGTACRQDPWIQHWGPYKSSHKFWIPGLIYRCFLLKPCTGEGEWSNIFANPPAKWLPPLNIVEYPGVTGATCCHIIPLCLKSHHSKSGTPGKVVLKGGGGRLPRTEVECSPGTRTGRRSLNVKRCSCSSGPRKSTRASRLSWMELNLLPSAHLFVLCLSALLAQLLSEAWMLLFRRC